MMASKHVIQFYALNQLKRGEIAYNDGHVLQMDFDSSVKPLLLKGVVQASQRKDVKYKVEIHYDEQSGLNKENCKCTCAVGQDICHHMAALLFFAHYNISSTDVECRWRAPKAKSTEACQSLEQIELSVENLPLNKSMIFVVN
ncbi:uncharacterized protein LOC108908830 isoform X1 [Anoplophora glabripennis]|uniref:uncharacterized protein LOC108908830 isoform X1 n=1 Tax=Anoplophora glabripennis TaxID=217634 RepID=UPI000873F5F8|nr:uncharacterized protein LOC108908830 isoform X1 [Anoplophora glabripennis]